MSAEDFDRLAGVAAQVVELRRKPSAKAGEVADFANPLAAAQSIVALHYMEDGLRTLHYWQGEFHSWAKANYVIVPRADFRAKLYAEGGAASEKPVKKRAVDDVEDAARAVCNLSVNDVPAMPAWIGPAAGDPAPTEVVPLRNGLLRLDTRELLPPTPRYFASYCLPVDFGDNVESPEVWIEFLRSVWPEDLDSVQALQEWFGYLLTADTSLQKALMIVGPKRSGKGTIARVLVRLLGDRNIASPTLASLGQPFGLQALIGKVVAIMSDARLGKQADIAAIAESLLRVTGEDYVNVARKFLPDYTAKLLARIVVLANEVPTFRDAAAALPSRFIILTTEHSFYGREDHQLDAKLAAELPGILLWALDGLDRLRRRGRFLQPRAGLDELRVMEDLASPIGAFLRDACVIEPGATVPIAKLYSMWKEWCTEHGRGRPGTEQTFGRDMRAAVPGLGENRPRVNGVRVRMYSGIRIRTPDDPPPADEEEADGEF